MGLGRARTMGAIEWRTEASSSMGASSDPTLAKRLNKGRQLPAEVVEGRASPKGNSR